MRKFGIDVSQHQGSVNWDRASVRIGYAFCKVTEGLGFVDPTWSKKRVEALREAGVIFGGYHFARPQPGRDGADEAEAFVKELLKAGWGKRGDLPGALDIEYAEGVSRRQAIRHTRRFVKRYRELVHHRPIIYTGHFWRDFLGNPLILSRCRLWLAAYTDTWHGFVPRSWKRPFFWQFTDRSVCPGVLGPVDGNRLLRTATAFQRARLKGK